MARFTLLRLRTSRQRVERRTSTSSALTRAGTAISCLQQEKRIISGLQRILALMTLSSQPTSRSIPYSCKLLRKESSHSLQSLSPLLRLLSRLTQLRVRPSRVFLFRASSLRLIATTRSMVQSLTGFLPTVLPRDSNSRFIVV